MGESPFGFSSSHLVLMQAANAGLAPTQYPTISNLSVVPLGLTDRLIMISSRSTRSGMASFHLLSMSPESGVSHLISGIW